MLIGLSEVDNNTLQTFIVNFHESHDEYEIETVLLVLVSIHEESIDFLFNKFMFQKIFYQL